MNRRVMIFAGLLLLLMVTGGLTSFVAANGSGSLIPVLTVTSNAESSVNQVTGNQAIWLVGWIAFVVFNLAGASLTGMAIFWFLNRGVERAKAQEPAQHETIGDALRLPARSQGVANEDEDGGELPATT
jgi:hypothetical protein